ncbi:MAG: lysylphosphatidylglycerol synthase domain-containing protein [Chitinophagaceae bacterium]
MEKFLDLNKSIKILINYALSPLLFLWLLWSSYHQIMKQHDILEHWQIFIQALSGKESWKLWLTFFLVFMNWGIEAIKWKQIISPVQKLSFINAFKATLAGVAFALNTPNRIGEYGARIMYIEEGKRIRAISLTVVSSMSQLAVTLMAGLLGLIFMQDEIKNLFFWSDNISWVTIAVLALMICTILFFIMYFRIAGFMRLLFKIPSINRFSVYLQEIKNLPLTILWSSFLLSICRFLVFVSQYILLLQVMHVEIPFWESVALISILFLGLAIVPTITLLELGMRWELSLLLFGIYSQNFLGIFMVASIIWLFNLLIPAILGSLSILRLRIFKVEE